jgi:hypothetical protein
MIKEEQLNKLNQLDRIEYLLKSDRLEKRYEGSMFYNIILWFLAWTFLIIFLCIEGYHIFGIDFVVSIMENARSGTIVWIIGLGLGLLYDILMIYKKSKEENKLTLEFFEVKVKKENK